METKPRETPNTRTELYRRESRHRATGETTVFRILAGPGGRYYYSKEIMEKDRLIYIELSQNGTSIEFPFSIRDQERMWEFVFDVWQKPEKIIAYVQRFFKLAHSKLSQRKLDGMAKVYMIEGDKADSPQRPPFPLTIPNPEKNKNRIIIRIE